LVTRIRGGFQIFRQEFQPDAEASIYLTERVTRTYEAFLSRFPNTVGTEYLGPDCEPGSIVDGTRHEDIQRLSFGDESFDFVASYDVLEHVPRHNDALRELQRVLRPGGGMLITVPFRLDLAANETRAEQSDDGTIRHMLEPEYHGNPVDPAGGSLAYRTFGWQLLDDLRQAGFSEPRAMLFWSEHLRYFGDPQVAVVARKAPTAAEQVPG
jgi:SAM-dependent methyltransferase